VEYNSVKIVKFILEHNLAFVDDVDDTGATPLHQAVYDGNIDCIKLLIDWKAKLNIRDNRGEVFFFFLIIFFSISILF
jgi:ankyrin repeat protein